MVGKGRSAWAAQAEGIHQQLAEIQMSAQVPPTLVAAEWFVRSFCMWATESFVRLQLQQEQNQSCRSARQANAAISLMYLDKAHKSDTLQGLFFQSVCIYGALNHVQRHLKAHCSVRKKTDGSLLSRSRLFLAQVSERANGVLEP